MITVARRTGFVESNLDILSKRTESIVNIIPACMVLGQVPPITSLPRYAVLMPHYSLDIFSITIDIGGTISEGLGSADVERLTGMETCESVPELKSDLPSITACGANGTPGKG